MTRAAPSAPASLDRLGGFWLTTPNWQLAEILAGNGFRRVILDVEHGPFGHETLHAFIPFCKGLGLEVYVKVLAPERSPVQTVLDFGAEGVIIPHLQDVDHASQVCSYAKFPPLGDRSLAGGRAMAYRPVPDTWFGDTDSRIRCYAMIETAGALADVEAIAALPTVDGLFPGPTDLSLRRGRGFYQRSPQDWADLRKIADAARTQRKDLVFPAWTPEERHIAAGELGARFVFSGMEMLFMASGVAQLSDTLRRELNA